jgi:hypothetical protein
LRQRRNKQSDDEGACFDSSSTVHPSNYRRLAENWRTAPLDRNWREGDFDSVSAPLPN